MINIKLFLTNKEIFFDSDKQMMTWVRRNLRLSDIVKVGPNYMADEKNLERALKEYMINQKQIYEKKAALAKKLAARVKRRKSNDQTFK